LNDNYGKARASWWPRQIRRHVLVRCDERQLRQPSAQWQGSLRTKAGLAKPSPAISASENRTPVLLPTFFRRLLAAAAARIWNKRRHE
jgi:hypothetical protein